jgi:membrane protein implicated in regulation of membrane protease activity
MVVEWVGLTLIIAGVILLGLELAHPGALLLIPAFMLMTAGVLVTVFGDSLLASLPGVGAIVAAAIFAALIEIPYYRWVAPTHRPMTTTTAGLAGQFGVVTVAVQPNNMRGKVRVQREIWSAQSDRAIPAGTQVRIVAGDGVAIQVVPVETTKQESS